MIVYITKDIYKINHFEMMENKNLIEIPVLCNITVYLLL